MQCVFFLVPGCGKQMLAYQEGREAEESLWFKKERQKADAMVTRVI